MIEKDKRIKLKHVLKMHIFKPNLNNSPLQLGTQLGPSLTQLQRNFPVHIQLILKTYSNSASHFLTSGKINKFAQKNNSLILNKILNQLIAQLSVHSSQSEF